LFKNNNNSKLVNILPQNIIKPFQKILTSQKQFSDYHKTVPVKNSLIAYVHISINNIKFKCTWLYVHLAFMYSNKNISHCHDINMLSLSNTDNVQVTWQLSRFSSAGISQKPRHALFQAWLCTRGEALMFCKLAGQIPHIKEFKDTKSLRG
jgi:hypothetical protein